jgi:hypothetical protein
VANLLPQEKLVFDTKVVGLDLGKKEVTCENGDTYVYQKLLTTMPLDTTLKMVWTCPYPAPLAPHFTLCVVLVVPCCGGGCAGLGRG